MKHKVFKRVLLVLLIALPAQIGIHAQKDSKNPSKPLSEKQLRELDKKKARPPSGASFYIGVESGGAPGRFSLLLTDENKRFTTQSYSLNQLGLVEAVLMEAKGFAYTAEASGTKKPVTTRFFDKQEPSFIVDVSKLGMNSQFYVTLIALDGAQVTVDAGTIKRDDPESKAMFLTIIEKIQTAKANTH